MNIFYFILDYFVLYLCFPSCLSVPVHKDVALTKQQAHLMFLGQTCHEIPWYYLLLLFCVETTTHIQVQGMVQMNQDKIMYSCIHFTQITSPLDESLFIKIESDL